MRKILTVALLVTAFAAPAFAAETSSTEATSTTTEATVAAPAKMEKKTVVKKHSKHSHKAAKKAM